MRRITAIVLSLFMFAMLAACPPPNPNDPKAKYSTGYTIVTYGKFVIQAAHAGFKGFVAVKHNECNDVVCAKLHPDKKSDAYKGCMAQDHSTVAEFKTCYGKLGEAEAIIDKAVPLSLSIMTDVKEILDLKVQYDIAKEAAKQKPEELKNFCDTVFPAKSGAEYTTCLKGGLVKKFDYMAAFKGRACTAYYGFAFVPAPYNKYTDPVRMWFKSYGDCK
jgi:hypothetical protein